MQDDMSTKAKALTEAALCAKDVMSIAGIEEALYDLAEQQPIDSHDLPVLIDAFVTLAKQSND